jgi:hypothetical protein
VLDDSPQDLHASMSTTEAFSETFEATFGDAPEPFEFLSTDGFLAAAVFFEVALDLAILFWS